MWICVSLQQTLMPSDYTERHQAHPTYPCPKTTQGTHTHTQRKRGTHTHTQRKRGTHTHTEKGKPTPPPPKKKPREHTHTHIEKAPNLPISYRELCSNVNVRFLMFFGELECLRSPNVCDHWTQRHTHTSPIGDFGIQSLF